MLDPQDRAVLLESLAPPDGFVLDEAIVTTYSLDLVTLTGALLAFTPFEWEDTRGEMTSNPVILLEALRRNADRLTVYCQIGHIHAPERPNILVSTLEGSVVQVASPNTDGVFHPKLWVLRYRSEESDEVRYRLLCLSRNLTDDPSWDLSLRLEGTLADRKVGFSVNRPLGDFVAALPALAPNGVSTEVRNRAERMAGELRRVDFLAELPEPFENLAFLPMGIEGYRRSPQLADSRKLLVVSPFIDTKTARDLTRGADESILVSRQEELDRLPVGSLEDWDKVYVLAQRAEGEVEPGGDIAQPDADSPRGLHAKLFVTDEGWDARLLLGSANATSAAFGRNVEFLIELAGKRSRIGVDQLLTPGTGEAGLVNLLQEYSPPDTPLDDGAQRVLDERAEQVRMAMALANWQLQAEPSEGSQWRMRMTRSGADSLSLDATMAVRVWPVTFPSETSAQSLSTGTTEVAFAAAGIASITSFIACEVVARAGDLSRTLRFVLNLPLMGAPAGRREALLRHILDDPSKVLRFLQFLLDDAPTDPMAGEEGTHLPSSGGASRTDADFVLLEALLRALVRDPKRLDSVEAVIRDFTEHEEAGNRLPTGLLNIWPSIWAARQAVHA